MQRTPAEALQEDKFNQTIKSVSDKHSVLIHSSTAPR